MAPLEVRDPHVHDLVAPDAAIERIAGGLVFTEGPVWRGGALLFSDIPNNRIARWRRRPEGPELTTFVTGMSNGLTLDRQGRVLAAEHYGRRVTRVADDGTRTVLAEHFQGKRLNSPNDIVVKSDGSIWFTDPGYGIMGHYEGEEAEFELPRRVYRIDPHSGATTVVADDFDRPNGLCFSPDESLLYIVDTGKSHTPGGPAHIRVFPVNGDRLGESRVFAEIDPGFADGLRADRDGNIWAGVGWGGDGQDGVHCFAPTGELLGRIHLPEGCANLCFGGYRKSRLFMAAGQSLYAVYLNTVGAQTP